MRYFFYLLFIIGLSIGNSNCCNHPYHECRLAGVDSLLFSYEEWLVNNKNGKIHISLSTDEYVHEIFMEYIGSINVESDSIFLIKNEALFGTPESPHGNGSITIYKNKCWLGKYIWFNYGFSVWIENNELYINNLNKDGLISDTISIICFDRGIPMDFIVHTNDARFGEYIYLDSYKSIISQN